MEEERHDGSTWMLADEVNWPDPELRCMNRGAGRLRQEEGVGLRCCCWSVRGGARAARQAGVAGGWRLWRTAEGAAYERGRTLGSRLERRNAAGEGAAASGDGRRSCSGGAEGRSDGGRRHPPATSNFSNWGVVWYFSSFSPGRRNPPATTISVQRE